MKNSNLAQRLEEFATDVSALDEPNQKPAQRVAVANVEKPVRAPRRLSFDTRRIQIRDTGLARFRIF